MNDDLDGLVSLSADELGDIRIALDGINISAERVSRTITRAFAGAIVSGKSFEAILKSLAESFARMALTAGLKPLQQGFAGLPSSVFGSFGGAGPSIAPFAEGGIVSRPVFFGSGGGLGLMGERGAEAIVPLARGPDGRLGLAANEGRRQPFNITVNISTPDAASFKRSQVQVASAMARAVARGQRGM